MEYAYAPAPDPGALLAVLLPPPPPIASIDTKDPKSTGTVNVLDPGVVMKTVLVAMFYAIPACMVVSVTVPELVDEDVKILIAATGKA